ncbi:MAG TPA: methyltransferase domain-containing protein [Thermoleophilaceae bacterium]
MSTADRQDWGLPNEWELAETRLELLEASHDPSSIQRATALGVGPGWDCLEAGAGHGSFARWLASRVGESGSVLAVDIDTRLLEGIEGVEVRRMDLAADELPREAFDFAHSRLVLMHIPSRDEVLRRLTEALRPGGLLMVEEDDSLTVQMSPDGPYREAWHAFVEVMSAAGTDPAWARDLPRRLDSLGLDDVDAEVVAQLFRGRSDPARFWSLSWLQTRERVVAAGVPADLVDSARAALEDPGQWFHGPSKIMAWGRRPG